MHPVRVMWLADSTPTGSVDLSPLWLQYGAIGLMCAVLIWFAFKAYRREADRADRLESEVARLNQVMTEAARTSGEQIASMRDMINFLKSAHSPESTGGG